MTNFKLRLSAGIILFILNLKLIQAQTGIYAVTPAPFSSNRYDEFSPVYYRNSIVFTTNRGRNLLFNYSPADSKGLYKINVADTATAQKRRKPKLFSETLMTHFNDGPVCFNRTGDTIYYSSNLIAYRKFRDLNESRNSLGIFSSVRNGETWGMARELRINNEWYNVTTPWLSPDSKRLFFASDKPGGFGGSDLYYCQWAGGYWDNPVNLGPVINTSGNEAFPFVLSPEEIFFSSDGHKGYGGKDIFYSRFEDSNWLAPVPLDPPMNSAYNDFGLVTDSLMNSGYFSTSRGKSIDIYSFTTEFPQIFYPKSQMANQYCFRISDMGKLELDTRRLIYEWSFSDGGKATGEVVDHCFPGPGKYEVRLSLVDRTTGKTVFTRLLYDLELRDIEQPYITSTDAALTDEMIAFDGLKSNLPDYNIIDYTWDFGDGKRANGNSVTHSYSQPGIYTVIMGIKSWQASSRVLRNISVSKSITIVKDKQELVATNKMISMTKNTFPDINSFDPAKIDVRYSAADEILKGALLQVEIMSSGKRLGRDNQAFRRISQKYRIKEIHNIQSGQYSYIIGEELSIIAAYSVLTDAVGMGFRDSAIRTSISTDPAENELNALKRLYGLSADNFFDKTSNRITSTGYSLLDQIATIMNKYQTLRLSVEIHCDEPGTDWFNLNTSQKRAESMLKYLVSKSIDNGRISITGYGRSRRLIAEEKSETARRINSRIQYEFIN